LTLNAAGRKVDGVAYTEQQADAEGLGLCATITTRWPVASTSPPSGQDARAARQPADEYHRQASVNSRVPPDMGWRRKVR